MKYLLQLFSQISINPDDINVPQIDPDSSNSVATILEVVFGILGAIALLVIVIAGLNFVLSRAEPDKSSKARNTIIYAAVGLVIAMLAFTLVRFVVREVA